MLTANQIASDHFVAVRPESTIGKAIERAIEENTSILLVVNEQGQLVGTVADSVMIRATIDSQLRNSPVSLHMSRRFASVLDHAPVDLLLDQFVLHDLKYLAVVNDGRLTGVINQVDLLRVVFGNKPDAIGIPGVSFSVSPDSSV